MFNLRLKNILAYDTFYLTYDEPEKDQRWKTVKDLLPNAQRVDGIKGFDAAHKECARLANTERVVIIDGDNSFISTNRPLLKIKKKLLKKPYVFSYSSINSINGLIYGNGGVKCWPRETLLSIKSHEFSDSEENAVDFCFSTPYYQMPDAPTISNVNITPHQAFRAGFREGVKMTLDKGLPLSKDQLNQHGLNELIPKSNFFRLKTWCEIGRDVENGIWAIYGARLGCRMILSDPNILESIRDYDWFIPFWEKCSKSEPDQEAIKIKHELELSYSFLLDEVCPERSREFKSKIENPHREGLMFPDMEI
jgi:hypothetical protein